MAVLSCSIGEYKSLPANARVTAVYLGHASTQVSSTIEVLRFVCESCVRSRKLNKERVRSFGFGWLGLHPQTMRCARCLGPGVYLAEDGQGSTHLFRTTLLLKRLMIPLDHCKIDYECLGESSAVTLNSSVHAESFLSLWDDGEEEPEDSVQKRLHEFTAQEKDQLVPYKVGIGMRRYAVSSWSDFANTFIAYVYLHFGDKGPKLLLDLQASPSWKHLDHVKSGSGGIEMNPVVDGLSGAHICQFVSDILSGIGFDRYSVYLMCAAQSGMMPQGAQKESVVASSWRETVKIANASELACILSPDAKSVENGDEDVEVVELTLGRHLRPIFRVIDE